MMMNPMGEEVGNEKEGGEGGANLPK